MQKLEEKRLAVEAKKIQEERRNSALQEARDAAATAARTRADMAAKTEEERKLRADALERVRCVHWPCIFYVDGALR